MASTDLGTLQPLVVARFSRPLQSFLLGEFPELLQVRKKVFRRAHPLAFLREASFLLAVAYSKVMAPFILVSLFP